MSVREMDIGELAMFPILVMSVQLILAHYASVLKFFFPWVYNHFKRLSEMLQEDRAEVPQPDCR